MGAKVLAANALRRKLGSRVNSDSTKRLIKILPAPKRGLQQPFVVAAFITAGRGESLVIHVAIGCDADVEWHYGTHRAQRPGHQRRRPTRLGACRGPSAAR